ncbi:MAG: HIT family protein [Burkholderiales bacterium]|nr:HIT family protein [Burkholderiales bacterium]
MTDTKSEGASVTDKDCPLCNPKDEEVIFNNDLFRLVYVHDKDYPGYLRLIMNKHVKEMSELTPDETKQVIATLRKAEKVLIDVLDPTKVNWEQLGNIVQHLHWHLIPRFEDDPTFPNPIWSLPQRQTPEAVKQQRQDLAKKAISRIKDTFFKSPHPEDLALRDEAYEDSDPDPDSSNSASKHSNSGNSDSSNSAS